MIRKIAFAVLFVLTNAALALPVDVACHWDEPVRYQGATSTVLERLYAKASEPAYFSIDADAGYAAHSDPSNLQSGLFPKLTLFSSRDSVKIIAPSPNVQDLPNTQAVLEIVINRYTLESTMVLAMPSSTPDIMAAQWSRAGRCNARKL